MSQVSMRELFEAGAHFGHRTRFWNPKMAPYIYGKRGDIHIIDLEQTVVMLNDALNFLSTVVANGGRIMFVGTKRSASEAIEQAATRCAMPYVNFRWLGGMLTNFKTIRQSLRRLEEIEKMAEEGIYEKLAKKEVIVLERERAKLERSLNGIRTLKQLPDVLFVIDVGYEHIAIKEARKLDIPVVGVVDTNGVIEGVDYLIPGNDDSVRAIRLYVEAVADAIEAAKQSVTSVREEEESASQETTQAASRVVAASVSEVSEGTVQEGEKRETMTPPSPPESNVSDASEGTVQEGEKRETTTPPSPPESKVSDASEGTAQESEHRETTAPPSPPEASVSDASDDTVREDKH